MIFYRSSYPLYITIAIHKFKARFTYLLQPANKMLSRDVALGLEPCSQIPRMHLFFVFFVVGRNRFLWDAVTRHQTTHLKVVNLTLHYPALRPPRGSLHGFLMAVTKPSVGMSSLLSEYTMRWNQLKYFVKKIYIQSVKFQRTRWGQWEERHSVVCASNSYTNHTFN